MAKPQTIQDIKPTSNQNSPDTGTPIIVKHQAVNTQINNNQSSGEDVAGINTVSNTAATITPPSENLSQTVSEPPKENVSENTQPPKEETATESAKEEEPDKPAINEPFAAVDALPSKSAQDTTATTNDMQQPRIYDTKEYFVPIHDTSHKHGHMLGTVIAGIISALLVLAIIYFVARGL